MTVLARFLPFFFKQWPAYPLQFISRGLAISFVTQTDIQRHWNSVGKISFFFIFLSFFPSLSSFHLLLLHAVPIWHHHRNDLYNDDTRAFRMRRKGEPLVKTFCGSPGATYRQIQLGRRPVGNRIYRPPAIPGRQVAHINGLLPKCMLHNNNWVRNIRSIVGR